MNKVRMMVVGLFVAMMVLMFTGKAEAWTAENVLTDTNGYVYMIFGNSYIDALQGAATLGNFRISSNLLVEDMSMHYNTFTDRKAIEAIRKHNAKYFVLFEGNNPAFAKEWAIYNIQTKTFTSITIR